MNDALTKDEEERVFALLGDLASRFANMEFALHYLLQAMIDPCHPIVGSILLGQMSLREKISRLAPLASYRFLREKEKADNIRAIAEQLESIRARRNQFVHGQWEFNPEYIRRGRIRSVLHRFKFTAKGQGMEWRASDLREWTADEIKALSSTVGKLTIRMLRLAKDIAEFPEPPEEE